MKSEIGMELAAMRGTNAYREWSICEADLVSSMDNSKLSGKPRGEVPASWQGEKGSGVPSQQRE